MKDKKWKILSSFTKNNKNNLPYSHWDKEDAYDNLLCDFT